MNFKLEDFKIEIIEHSKEVLGGQIRASQSTPSPGCTDGDVGCCDNDVADDEGSDNAGEE